VRTKNRGQGSEVRGQLRPNNTGHRPLATGHRQFGFTLLEVIVSMAIIATALVALLSLQGRSIGMMESAGKMEGARLLSERLMGEGELKGVPNGEKKGTEGPYNWRISEIKITPEVMPEGVKALPGRQLSLEVSWEEGKRKERLNLAEYIYER